MSNGIGRTEIRECDADKIRGLFMELSSLSNDIKEKARALCLPRADESKPALGSTTPQGFPDFATEMARGLKDALDTLYKAQDSLVTFIG